MLSTNQPTAHDNRSFILLICGTAALGGFLFGFDTAIINSAVAALQAHFQANSGLQSSLQSLTLSPL